MLLTLGEFVFWALGTPFTSIERDTKWRVSPHKRVGQRPLLQFVGPDDDRITISGTLYPQLTDGPASIEELRWCATTTTRSPTGCSRSHESR